jgi:hypothetical protein
MAILLRSYIPAAARCATAVFVSLGVGACNAPGPQVPSVSGVAATPATCADVVNAAALKAVGQTHPLGQILVFGSPVNFGRGVWQAQVNVSNGVQFNVNVRVDRNCNVRSAVPYVTENPSNG